VTFICIHCTALSAHKYHNQYAYLHTTVSQDAPSDPRFAANVDQRLEHKAHSLICAPIILAVDADKKSDGDADAKEEFLVIGAIIVRDEEDRGGFKESDEEILLVVRVLLSP
jgi:hypothetical protein